ncbi:MAG: aldehyde ferredoxin oxidoreductase family protein [Anaerolineales bacterium]|nr:aldehyde ferredoxin oxidoreductase family protein [Anaerolineales bacterium]
MNAYAGRVARVDLTSGKWSVEESASLTQRFLGGRGVNSWILLNQLAPGVDPLSPENLLVFGAGALVGTMAPAACYTSIGSKNLSTGGINYAHAGGHFAPAMKQAGFDNLIVSGRSERPVYLYLHNGKVELKDASHLWGKTTWETQEKIREELVDDALRFLTIGPAGENLVRFAIAIVDKTRAAASGGLGAIMGSKNLKAIVAKPTEQISIAHPRRFQDLANSYYSLMKNSDFVKLISQRGTHGTYSKNMNESCSLPTRNVADDHWDPDRMAIIDFPQILSGETNVRKLEERFPSCHNCPIQCGFVVYEVVKGPYAGLKLNAFEANAVFAFGSRCDIVDFAALLKIFEQISLMGLDNDAAGVVISWAIDCYQKGILKPEDTGGMPLAWGDAGCVLELLRMISQNDGFGALLARGVQEASKVIGRGSEYYAIHCKGQDNVDALRSAKGWGFGNVVSLRGGRHLDGSPTTEYQAISRELGEKLYGVPTAGDQTAYEGKGKLTFWYSCFKAAVDALGICYYTTWWGDHSFLGPKELAAMISEATGSPMSADDLFLIGQRIVNIEKAFNTIHGGFSRADDMPPKIFVDEPIKSGRYRGELLDECKWNEMLDEFYEMHGWANDTGQQTRDGLLQLDLSDVWQKLEAHSGN